jgi:hypothetical protein
MWPFKKRDNRPRILLVDAWREDGALDLSVRRVSKVGSYFVMQKYDFSDEVFILEPAGTFRGKPKMTWEQIDVIPGLTEPVSVA